MLRSDGPTQRMSVKGSKTAPRLTLKPWGGRYSGLNHTAIQTLFLGIIASVMLFAALDAASMIAIPTVLALLCAIALAPSVRWLERTGAPATLCAALVVGGLLMGTALTVYSFAPSAEAFNTRAPQILREAEWRARQIISELAPSTDGTSENGPQQETTSDQDRGGVTNPDTSSLTDADKDSDDTSEDADTVAKLVEGGQRLLADLAISAPGFAAGVLLWAMLTFFLLRDRVMLARWGMSIVPHAATRRAVGRAMRDVRTDVANYLLAITMINAVIGVLVAVAFHLVGISNAPLWGVAAALANFMPFIGFAILAVVSLAVGITSFNDPLLAVAPFVIIVILNAIEANVVTPMILGSRIRIAPITIFMAIALGAWLWGAAGALVATPALIVVIAFVRRLNPGTRSPKPPQTRPDRRTIQ